MAHKDLPDHVNIRPYGGANVAGEPQPAGMTGGSARRTERGPYRVPGLDPLALFCVVLNSGFGDIGPENAFLHAVDIRLS